MRSMIIGNLMSFISKNGNYSNTKLEEIEYGLVSIYILITKLFIIILLAFLLHIQKQVLIFLVLYNVIRMPSFGLHATKSWICLVVSTVMFIGGTLLCQYVTIPIWEKIGLGIVLLFLFYQNAPADTYKRPIINAKRRLVYKYISIFVCIIFIFSSIYIPDNFLSNCFLITLVVQAFMISPTIYKLFRLPYNNYKTYMKEAI